MHLARLYIWYAIKSGTKNRKALNQPLILFSTKSFPILSCLKARHEGNICHWLNLKWCILPLMPLFCPKKNFGKRISKNKFCLFAILSGRGLIYTRLSSMESTFTCHILTERVDLPLCLPFTGFLCDCFSISGFLRVVLFITLNTAG